jgi:hypothetical protein
MEVASRQTSDPRQFDIPLTTQYYFITPTDVPGRITTDDFLFFTSTDSSIKFSDYDVLVESFNGKFKKLGQLSTKVQLPHVHFLNDALLLVLPKNSVAEPKFIGTIQRGKQYVLSFNKSEGDFFLLK